MGHPEAFFRTRPIKSRDIVLAKILFCFLFLLCPFLLVETVLLAFSGISFSVLLASMAEIFVFLTCTMAALAATTLCCRHMQQWAKSVLVCIAFPWLVAFIWDSTARFFEWNILRLGYMSWYSVLFMLGFITVSFVLYSNRFNRHQNPGWKHFIPYACVFGVLPLFSIKWQSGLGGISPEQGPRPETGGADALRQRRRRIVKIGR